MAKVTYNSEKRTLSLSFNKHDETQSKIFELLKTNGFKSTVPMKYSKKRNEFLYDLSDLLSIRSRLKSVVSVKDFYFLLQQLYYGLINVFSMGIHPSTLDWDADLVFLDVNGRVYFIVYPMKNKTVEAKGLINLVELIMKKAKPLDAVDKQAFDRLLGYLNQAKQSGKKADLSKFLNNLGVEVQNYCGANLPDDYQSEMLKVLMLGLEQVSKPEEEIETVVPFQGVNLDMSYVSTEVKEKTMLEINLDNEEDDERTGVMLDEGRVNRKPLKGILTRRTGEVFDLNPLEADTWLFGRTLKESLDEQTIHYKLAGNKWVSGHHFEIEWEQSSRSFYVTDLSSSNGTWLDGVRCGSDEPLAMADGSILKVANEELTFKLEEM